MSATSRTSIRTFHPTMAGVVAAFASIPILILATWPAASKLGDARIMVEFVGVPLFCFCVLPHLLHINSFDFRHDTKTVQIQPRLLLFAVGDPIHVAFQTITDLEWDFGEAWNLSMTVAGEKRYYVTGSRSKARQIAQIVLQAQPNLKPNLHRDLIAPNSL